MVTADQCLVRGDPFACKWLLMIKATLEGLVQSCKTMAIFFARKKCRQSIVSVIDAGTCFSYCTIIGKSWEFLDACHACLWVQTLPLLLCRIFLQYKEFTGVLLPFTPTVAMDSTCFDFHQSLCTKIASFGRIRQCFVILCWPGGPHKSLSYSVPSFSFVETMIYLCSICKHSDVFRNDCSLLLVAFSRQTASQ